MATARMALAAVAASVVALAALKAAARGKRQGAEARGGLGRAERGP